MFNFNRETVGIILIMLGLLCLLNIPIFGVSKKITDDENPSIKKDNKEFWFLIYTGCTLIGAGVISLLSLLIIK